MNALLYWLRLGLAAFLAIAPPTIAVDDGAIVARLESEHLLTQEMRELVEGGVPLSFELYCSARAPGSGGASLFASARIRRKIRYDYLRDTYVVEEGAKTLCDTICLDDAEKALRNFACPRLELGKGWKKASFFAELRCLGDPMLEERFGKDGAGLWGGYRPSMKIDVDNPAVRR
jgi:hypothetical protein